MHLSLRRLFAILARSNFVRWLLTKLLVKKSIYSLSAEKQLKNVVTIFNSNLYIFQH